MENKAMASRNRKRKANEDIVANGRPPSVTPALRPDGTLSAREAIARQQQAQRTLISPAARPDQPIHDNGTNQESQICSLDYDSEAGMESEESADEQAAEDAESKTEELTSSWVPTKDNHISLGTSGERLKLGYNDILTIVGQYRIKVIYGVISIYGAILTSKSPQQMLVAPINQSLPSLRCVSGDWAEIELSSVSAQEDIESLRSINPQFGGIWQCQCAKCSVHASKRTYSKLRRCDDHHQYQKVSTIINPPIEWQACLSSLIVKARARSRIRPIAIIGSPGSDTTTSIHWMINVFLTSLQGPISNSIGLLELRPDDPLVGIPGHVSLSTHNQPILRPPWSRCTMNEHKHTVLSSYATGIDLSKSSDVMMQITRQLLKDVHEQFKQGVFDIVLVHLAPWSQGLNKSKIRECLELLDVKDVVLVGPSKDDELLRFLSSKEFAVVTIPNINIARPSISASQRRSLALQAYFHSSHQNAGCWIPSPLSSWRPYVISYKTSGTASHAGIGTDFKFVNFCKEIPAMRSNLMRDLLNGSLVSVHVQIDESENLVDLDISRGQGDGIPYISPSGSLADIPSSRSIGMALIRSIDVDNQEFHVLSPIEMSTIDPQRVILYAGVVEMPSWAYEEDLHYRDWAKKSGISATPELFADVSSTSDYPWIEVLDSCLQ